MRLERTARPECSKSCRYNRDIDTLPLSIEEFQNAVAKGLGRAIVAVRLVGPGPYDDAIVESCLHDQQDNRYSEALRFPFQMRLIDLAGITARVRETLLAEIRTTTHTGDLDFMLLVLGGYARRDDPEAVRLLKEHALKGDDWPQQILAHTGDENLEWLIENVLPRLLKENSAPDQWIRRDEFPGSSPVRKRLRAILKDHRVRREVVADPPEGPVLSPRDYLDGLRAGSLPDRARTDFHKKATDEEYRELLEMWLSDPWGPALRYANSTLPCRPLPIPFARLIKVSECRDGWWALHHILHRMPQPKARAYALERLRDRPIRYDALRALQCSFETGDEEAIRTALPQIAIQDKSSRFGFLHELFRLMEEYNEAHWQTHAEWIYEHADDSWQRREAVEWMAKRGAVPEAIWREGLDDAEPAIRRICRARARAEQ